MPLGTLWFFCRQPRLFAGEQTNLAEMIAGRLASELDRALLLHEQVEAVALRRQLDEAARMQQHASSLPPPPLEGWQIAGSTSQAGSLGGAFHEWRMLADGRLAIAIADARDGGVAGAIIAASMRAALTSCLDSINDPAAILERLNDFIKASGAGDAWAGFALGIADLASGNVSITSAGRPTALWLASHAAESLLKPSLPLGLAESPFAAITRRLAPNDVLVLYNRGFVEAADEQGRPLNEAAVARALYEARDRSAGELIEVLCDRQEAHAVRPNQLDRSVVVLKRTR
jgi:serine phosphatase RsbU (regulator of sigma subunit)